MKQFGKIFSFELKYYLKNKIFVGVTLFLVILIAGVMFLPQIMDLFEGEEPTAESAGAEVIYEGGSTGDGEIMLVRSPEQSSAVTEAFAAAFPEYKVESTDLEIEDIKKQILSGQAECAFVLTDDTSYTYYVNNLSIYDYNTSVADEVLQNVCQMNAMIEKGIDPSEAGEIMAIRINGATESLGVDQMENYWYTYIMIFALYMVILLYGQMVAMNVATEKSSRAMEVLITSAKPVSMMFGKVIASCTAGFLQLASVFGAALLFFNLNKDAWGDNMIVNSIFNMPASLFGFMLLFFVLGFFIYAFLYGAIGSTASKLEDINTSVMPVTMIFIVAFMVVMFSLASGSVDNMLIKVCSFIPFTSPMAMFTRIAMSTVPWYEIAASVLILIGSVVGVGMISAKIYRVGVLLYGTTPKLTSILKAIKKS